MFHRVKSESPSEQVPSIKPAEKPYLDVAEKVRPEQNSAKDTSAEKSVSAPSFPSSPASVYKSGVVSSSMKEKESVANPAPKAQSYLQVSNKKEEDSKTMSDTISQSEKPMARASETAPASPYQRASTSSAGVTGYSPSYTSPYSQAPAAPSEVYSANERKLTIGRGITMSGEIESCDHLYVEGTVEAALKGAQVLEVAESGVFYGTVEIEEANIAGRFEGEIAVKGRLTLEATAVITGTISYGEIQIEAGAVIDGRMTPMTAAKASKAQAEDKKMSSGSSLFQESN